jgi:hypothetical protein
MAGQKSRTQPDEAPADRIGTSCAWLIIAWLRGWDEVPCIRVSLMVNSLATGQGKDVGWQSLLRQDRQGSLLQLQNQSAEASI